MQSELSYAGHKLSENSLYSAVLTFSLSATTAMCGLAFRRHGFAFRVGSVPEELGVAGAGAGGVQVTGTEEVGAAPALPGLCHGN